MNKLSLKRRSQGASIRATCRMTGVAKGTVLKLLMDLEIACEQYQDKALRDLPCKRTQCDELWSFCLCQGQERPGAVCGDLRLRGCVDLDGPPELVNKNETAGS